MEDYLKILTNTSIIINRIAFLLDQENISTRIKDHVESARLGGFGVPQNAIELYVPKADFESAQEIIDKTDITIDR
ncbi:putative signal transducing protein [Leeuwenhoekiella marinoflava]|uniref:putative signal transducing protein n=1 Tax=Leeuwenhoekiella marinoflava TaxID=988 RepID=UPI0030026AC6